MTRINKIKLISEQITTDAIGQPTTTETARELIAEVRSCSMSEFMSGRQSGITPAYVFRVSMFAYNGEKVLELDGKRYSIYRTYESDSNEIELYTEAELGVTNA